MYLSWMSMVIRIRQERGNRGKNTVKKQMDERKIDENE